MNEQKRNIEMAKEVNKLLPETKNKVDYYTNVIDSEKDLLKHLSSRQTKFFISKLRKKKEAIEMINLKNSIYYQNNLLESYVLRKNEYETWLDDMSRKVVDDFDNTIKTAKDINNIRLQNAIESFSKNESISMQEKVEFYLYIKQEIENNIKHKKHKR